MNIFHKKAGTEKDEDPKSSLIYKVDSFGAPNLHMDIGFYGDNFIHHYACAEESKIDSESSEVFPCVSLPNELVAAICVI